MVEETVFNEVVTCDHSYDRRCHQSYITTYEAHQEEECEENFRKICYIDYEEQAYDEVVEVCHTPLVKDCNTPGPEICKISQELNVDLLILGSPDRRPSMAKNLVDLDRLLGNSLSDYVRVYASCPVLLVR